MAGPGTSTTLIFHVLPQFHPVYVAYIHPRMPPFNPFPRTIPSNGRSGAGLYAKYVVSVFYSCTCTFFPVSVIP